MPEINDPQNRGPAEHAVTSFLFVILIAVFEHSARADSEY